MRLGCFLAVIGIGLTVLGWEGLHNAGSFKHPKTISYADFVKTRPEEGWFRVTGCEIDLAEAVYQRSTVPRAYKTGTHGESIALTPEEQKQDVWVDHAWLPVHDSAAEDKGLVGMVLSIEHDTPENEKILGTIEDFVKNLDGKSSGNKVQVQSWIHANIKRLVIDGDLTGMVDAGFLASEEDRKEVAQLSDSLSAGAVMLDNGHSPASTMGALGMLIAGIVVDLFALLVWLNFFIGLLGIGGRLVNKKRV